MNPASGAEQVKKAGAEVVNSKLAALFGRNTAASIVAFTIDIAILWLLVELTPVTYLPAAAIGFLIAMSVQYVISRIWVFPDSDQGIAKGYAYFLVNAGVGLVITLAVFAAFIWWVEIHYLLARLIASAVAGIAVFFLNAVFNFKEL
jgi:putative flippase GtrA